MPTSPTQLIWQQFGAAIDMLENALKACPDDLWDNEAQFWYIGYHTAYWMDYYLSNTPMERDYRPPSPFTASEFGTAMPERVYTRDEVLAFLRHGRQLLRERLTGSTADELAQQPFVSEDREFNRLELLLYNMRHVQHHTGQLNLLIRQRTGEAAPRWVRRTKEEW